MFGLGAPELLIILLVAVLIFGGTKIPKLARSVGQAKKEFDKGLDEGHTASDEDELTTADEKAAKKRRRT